MTLRTSQAPGLPLTLSMELPPGAVARLSCRNSLAFSQMLRLAGLDSTFPRPRRARAALKECRAALGRGLLWVQGRRVMVRPGYRPPRPWF